MVERNRADQESPGRGRLLRSKQVLVEGKEEVMVFRSLATYLDLGELEFRDYGGIGKLRTFLRAFTARGDFYDVRSLAIVADADFVSGSSADRVRGALGFVGLPVPRTPLTLAGAPERDLNVSFLVLPHWSNQGMLESVCLESVKSDPVMECVELFIGCVGNKRQDWPRREIEAKAKVHAFLASQDPPDLRLGEAASKGLWNFDDAAFDPLKELLISL